MLMKGKIPIGTFAPIMAPRCPGPDSTPGSNPFRRSEAGVQGPSGTPEGYAMRVPDNFPFSLPPFLCPRLVTEMC